MAARFSKEELNGLIIEDLGDRVVWNSGINSKTLLLDLEMPKRKLRIYVFNCTCPPGGRALDEYKIQMIIEGQSRGERGHINTDDGRIPLIWAMLARLMMTKMVFISFGIQASIWSLLIRQIFSATLILCYRPYRKTLSLAIKKAIGSKSLSQGENTSLKLSSGVFSWIFRTYWGEFYGQTERSRV